MPTFPRFLLSCRFWIESRQVRSNFGTTKYCATYLRNSPCQNPDCLYLHELGDEEDRFSKEEIQQRSLLAPPLPPGAVTVTGGGGPSGTGKRCTSPVLPPPVYESSDSGAGGGLAPRSSTHQQQTATGVAAVSASVAGAQRGAAGRGMKPAGQLRRDERDRQQQQQQVQRQREYEQQVQCCLCVRASECQWRFFFLVLLGSFQSLLYLLTTTSANGRIR